MDTMLTANNSRQLQELYHNYGGMLFGYIYEVVDDKKKAEKYLLEVFMSLSEDIESQNLMVNTWAELFRYTKHQLSRLHHTTNHTTLSPSETTRHKELHPSLNQLDGKQRKIFCDSYYHGKTIDAISTALNQPEALIRKTLRAAFIKIRNGSGN